jgi:hypothetical protein
MKNLKYLRRKINFSLRKNIKLKFYFKTKKINFQSLLRDYSIIFTPTRTPLSLVEFSRRYPCGETEKMKYTLKIFFAIRKILLLLRDENELQLPLKTLGQLVKENDSLDLSIC